VKCLLLQAGVGMGWTEDFQLISKLLSEVKVEAERLTPFHRRKLKPTAKLILDYYPALKSPFLQDLASISLPLEARESRWSREVAHILTKMQVKIEKRSLVHDYDMFLVGTIVFYYFLFPKIVFVQKLVSSFRYSNTVPPSVRSFFFTFTTYRP